MVSNQTTCPVCNGAEATEVVRFEVCSFVECRACGAIYKSLDHIPVDPKLYEGEYHLGKRSRRWAHRVAKAARQIRDVLGFVKAGSVLDIGCSIGYVVAAGQTLGLRAAGTDISQTACAAAQQRGLDVRQGGGDALPFADAAFDLVVMRHVLEHTPKPHDFLADVTRVLTQAGAVLILVPDPGYWKARVFPKTYRYYRPDDLGRQHFVYYTISSLSRLLQMHGFRVLATQKFAARPHASLMSRFIGWGWRWVARLGLRRELYVIAQRAPAP